MTKLRFIRPHGDKKAGDIQETESATTVRWLVDVYKVAVIYMPIITANPAKVVTDVTAPKDKALDMPTQDKMVRASSKKSRRH
jgi:hypothetical protein